MRYMEVVGVRELTESELLTVSGGGGVASAVVAVGAWVGGLVGGLTGGLVGAATGAVIGGGWVTGLIESAPVQGQISSDIGYLPSQTYF
jgi:hypothetical protein